MTVYQSSSDRLLEAERLLECLNWPEDAAVDELPDEERSAILHRYLVQRSHPIMLDAVFKWFEFTTIVAPQGAAVQQRLGRDSIPDRLIKEAAEIYYSKNRFVVGLYMLHRFLHGVATAGVCDSIAHHD